MKVIKFAIFSLLVLLIASASNTFSQLPESLGQSQGIYKTVDTGFDYFDFFELEKLPGQDSDNPDVSNDGRVEITGKLVLRSKDEFVFQKAYLSVSGPADDRYFKGIEFTTKRLNGLSFSFKGAFLDDWFQKNGNGPWIKIQGVMTKIEHGSVASEMQVDLYEYAIE